MTAAARPASSDEVPVLDLAEWLGGGSPADLVSALKAACTNTGFFYVTGHGVPQSVIDDAFEASRRYFAIPEEDRLDDVIDLRTRRGYVPFGRAKQKNFDPDLKESFDFGVDLPPDDPDVVAGRPMHAPNRWPAKAPWLKDAAQTYHTHLRHLGAHLLRLFALSLDEPEDFFVQWTHKPIVGTRLFHYPPQPVTEGAVLGAAPHTDYGMITILAQDPIGGLELRRRDGEWVAAPWIEGSFVVNLGDLLKMWTNDVYVSNLHRVVNRTGRERYSIPTFVNLDFDTPVACLPSCLAEGATPKYAPTTAGEYLVGRFRAVYS